MPVGIDVLVLDYVFAFVDKKKKKKSKRLMILEALETKPELKQQR